MQEIQSLCQGINEFLVLGGILTQIDLRLPVTGIIVILPAGEEIITRLIIVLVQDGHSKFISQFPSGLEVTVARM